MITNLETYLSKVMEVGRTVTTLQGGPAINSVWQEAVRAALNKSAIQNICVDLQTEYGKDTGPGPQPSRITVKKERC